MELGPGILGTIFDGIQVCLNLTCNLDRIIWSLLAMFDNHVLDLVIYVFIYIIIFWFRNQPFLVHLLIASVKNVLLK